VILIESSLLHSFVTARHKLVVRLIICWRRRRYVKKNVKH